MNKISQRVIEIGKSINGAVEDVTLTMTNESGEIVKEEPGFCEVCNKEVTVFENDYAWLLIDSNDGSGKDEIWFCSRECWGSWIIKRAKD